MRKLLVVFLMLTFLIHGVLLYAQDIGKTVFKLGEVVVSAKEGKEAGKLEGKSKIKSEVLKTHKIVDLAEILSDEMITASMIRKSGYGNEVGLRGFSQSNLRFFVDDTIVEGACGSRKDPSFSHIGLLGVDRIEVTEGPFDVTKAGALGGSVNVVTKKPQEGFHGELLEKIGSHGYWSNGAYFTGGNKLIQALLGYNYSQADQYKDGDGNSLNSFNHGYSEEGKGMKEFKKHDAWGKLQFRITDDQTLILSHTYGYAHDVMAPRAGMDIETERTNLSSAEYIFNDLGDYSDKLTVSFYHNKIEHNPYNKYRDASITDGYVKANDVETITIGGKIENEQSTDFADFTYGFDIYRRKWNGYMFNKDTGKTIKSDFFPDTSALGSGLYLKADKDIDKWSLGAGIRGDYFETKANDLKNGSLRYSQKLTDTNGNTNIFPSGYATAKYHINEQSDIFGGIGRSVRTPTLAERYLQASNGFYGNPDLKETKNTEADLGYQTNIGRVNFRIKGFYSWLEDYIYQQAKPKTWTNINAHIYGGDVSTLTDIGNDFSIGAAVAYQQGRKDSYPDNNSDKDLAQIPPLKTKLSINYDNSKFFGILEWICSGNAKDVDADAGEQKMKGWDVFNFRTGYKYKQVTFNIGVDNIFDKKYAVANSYEWDVVGGSSAAPNIVSEPGRFIYTSLCYAF